MTGAGNPPQQLAAARQSIARYRDEFVDLHRTLSRSAGRVSILTYICIHLNSYEVTV